jgi:hypothetical protein
MENSINDFVDGQRVQMHPATDLFMRGARYGNIVATRMRGPRPYFMVKLDALPRPIKVYPTDLLDGR